LGDGGWLERGKRPYRFSEQKGELQRNYAEAPLQSNGYLC